MALFSVMLASCDLFPDSTPSPNGFFYARNTTNNSFYMVEAEMLCEGEKCEIWVETGSGVTAREAKNIADEYDAIIRPRIVDAFSEKDFSYSFRGVKYDFDDMLDYANWLVDGTTGKLTILLLDIKDGYDEESGAYVAGYFDSVNFLEKGSYKINDRIYCSNGRDMIYVDTNPGMKEAEQLKQVYATFAHELQHLINFVTCHWLDKDSTDTWINEGLSAYAEYLYLGDHPQDRLVWLSDPRNTIKTGNNFFVWDNYPNKLTILDDYATVYLFFRWLYLQADAELQTHIFRDISNSAYSDYRAVTDVARNIKFAYLSWTSLLRTWLAANYYPENADYGYKGDEKLKKIIKIAPISGNNIELYPGEGVYSIIRNGSYSASNAGNIRYAGLTANTDYVDEISPYSGDTLLTFNANYDNSEGERETGLLTGFSSSVSVSRMAAESQQPENQQPEKWTRPYVIDAQDLLGRDRDKPIRQLLR